jgi:hypothetical protein
MHNSILLANINKLGWLIFFYKLIFFLIMIQINFNHQWEPMINY